MYTVIARKYRPQTFSEVVNQEHIKTTLRNAIEGQRLAHGYIFSGQRGTGKTTMARLLAKSLNCGGARPAGSVEPCLQCDSCREIAGGSPIDVIEIDAASNRGIDDIRGLRENARYAPARDPYKFFIIDEAHQLTKEAWNALLKTLEEPPPQVIFVLCTTESHSIPQTIASRCQTFSFHNLGFEETVQQLEHICKSENIEATDEALAVITQAGEGSMRDALSTLDQAIACCGSKLDGPTVRQLLGVVTTAALDEVVAAIPAQAPDRMLALVDELVREGQNLRNFVSQLTRHFRNLLVLKTAPKSPQLVETTKKEQERLSAVAAAFSEEDLTRYLQITLKLYADLHFSPQPRFHTELGLLKLIHAGRMASIEDMLARVEGGGGGTSAPPTSVPPTPAPTGKSGPSPFERDQSRRAVDAAPVGVPPPVQAAVAPVAQTTASAAPAASAPAAESSASSAQGMSAQDFSAHLIERVETMGKMILAINLERAAYWDVREESVSANYPVGTPTVNLPDGSDQRLLANMASEILGRPVSFRASMLKADATLPPPAAKPATATNLTNLGTLPANPEVADFMKHFPGARIEEQKRRG